MTAEGIEWDDSEVKRRLGRIMDLTEDPEGALGAAAYEAASKVAIDAGKMTPVDTGNLRGSTYVGSPQGSGSDIKVDFGQGAEYAASRHAMPSRGTNAKSRAHWWRKAIQKNSGSLLKNIARAAHRNLKIGQTFGASQVPDKIKPSNRKNPNPGAWGGSSG